MSFQPPPGYQAIYNPIVPYTGPIYGDLKLGMSLFIQGTVHNDANSFAVNLLSWQGGHADIALYFNPRLNHGNMVVMNSKVGGNWKSEERPSEMPFQKKESFQLLFLVTSVGYQIKVNDSEFPLFKHRMPVEGVSTLSIDGDVSVHIINIIGGGIGHMMGYPGSGEEVDIPYVAPIYGGLKVGMSLHIWGAVPCDATRFHISLQTSEAKCSDKALYINPRFKPAEYVVFSTFKNGILEDQERVTDSPFSLGERFEMVIFVTKECYQVNINHQAYTFKHRMPLARVLALGIGGDVFVESVNIKGEGQKVMTRPGPGYVGANHYTQPIPGGLKEGMSLYFRGTIHSEGTGHDSFRIILKGGGDLALCFNPRFGGWSYVVFNTEDNGRWQGEERVNEMPFLKGETFELVFVVTSEGYQVSVDGRDIHMYKHRVPLEQVTDLVIEGEVSVQTINIITEPDEEVKPENPEDDIGEQEVLTAYLHPHPAICVQDDIQEYPAPGDVSSSTYYQSIDGGLVPGISLYFEGTAHSDSNRFVINLKAGDDIAMHMTPRFRGRNVVVFASHENGKWKSEEIPSEMPFSDGADFQLVFYVTSEGYLVIVNGSVFHMFKHRIPVDRVNSLSIHEDATVRSVIIKRVQQDVIQECPAPGDVSSSAYSQSIDGGLVPGMSLYFEGTAHSDSNRFVINLKAGDDIAMHMTPRFRGRNVVVFASHENGKWKSEEIPSEMPFSDGADFQLVFNVTSEGYQVIVNGSVFHLFKHRIPLDRVNSLSIHEDATVRSVIIKREQGLIQEDPAPGSVEEQGVIQECPAPGDVSSSTYYQSIDGGLVPGMSLYFEGTAHSDSNRFYINLHAGDDVAMHITPRFRGRNVVVFASHENGKWKSEEIPSGMPFSDGADFQLVFNVTSEGYQVIVNGSAFHLFKHRIPLDRVNSLSIHEEATVRSVIIKREQGLIQEYPAPGSVKNQTYEEPIRGGLKTGMMLYFRGMVLCENVNSFAINLVAGGDLAMYFGPRFRGGKLVVFNSCKNGGWQSEERPSEMPFNEGSTFDLLFNVTLKGYQVIVDGRVLHMFKHRIPVDRVTALSITGDVFVESLGIIKGSEGSGGSGYNWRFLPMMGTQPIYSPPVPYNRMIPGGMIPRKTIAISGRVLPDADGITFNFYVSSSGDLAFSFNPRMNEGTVVRGNCLSGKWGREERDVKFNPFQKGEYFELLIRCGKLQFMVFGNGKHMFNFFHRFQPFTKIDTLHISGGVQLSYVLM